MKKIVRLIINIRKKIRWRLEVNNLANLNKFEAEIRRTPLWQLKNQIRQAALELELLKKDPSASHNEIAELDAKLTGWKLEYCERVKALKAG